MTKLTEMVEAVDEECFDNVPEMYSPEWSDYVLTQLTSDEKDGGGNPTVDGLRRLTGKLIGPIITSETNIIGQPNESNNYRATAVVTIEILDRTFHQEDDLDVQITKKISGAADAGPENIAGFEFQKFPVAMAETRAEGRALRKALGLRRVVATEELQSPATNSTEYATSTQINHFDAFCTRLNLDVMALINNLGKDNYNNIKDVPRETMAKFFETLGQFERKETDMTINKKIQSCKNYKKGWRGL